MEKRRLRFTERAQRFLDLVHKADPYGSKYGWTSNHLMDAYEAGIQHLLEYAKEKCFVDQTMTKYVSISDLEAFCGEGEK